MQSAGNIKGIKMIKIELGDLTKDEPLEGLAPIFKNIIYYFLL